MSPALSSWQLVSFSASTISFSSAYSFLHLLLLFLLLLLVFSFLSVLGARAEDVLEDVRKRDDAE